MKTFDRLIAVVAVLTAALILCANLLIGRMDREQGRPYLVEVSRLCARMEAGETVTAEGCDYVTAIVPEGGTDFFEAGRDYVIREVNGTLYRFEYHVTRSGHFRLILNLSLGGMAVLLLGVMLYLRSSVLKPFHHFSELPYELSKGNLTTPVKQTKNRFFGRFLWGVDLLRENIEEQKQRELDLLREKKMMLLSLSHDIKTPLSAIKLSARALSRGLYTDPEKQREVAQSIGERTDEIERYVTQIVNTAREDFMTFEVQEGEFYLEDLIREIRAYYTEKLALNHTEFRVQDYGNCLLRGDRERCIEVVQNLMENALKYGDGREIRIGFGEEDGCLLLGVTNTGCTLPEGELPHMFDSFWRGSNAGNARGSGLGLYICRQLMTLMGGDIFAGTAGEEITVTAVIPKS